MIFLFARKSGHVPDRGGKHFFSAQFENDQLGGSSDFIWDVILGNAFENRGGISNLEIRDFCLSRPHLRK